ncbi:MAG: FecR family protein [Chitinophagaceae bacterium]
MEEESFWHLLSLQLTGEATCEEQEALNQLLQTNPALGLQAQLLTQMWKKNNSRAASTDDFFNRHLQRLSNQPDIYPVPAEQITVDVYPPAEKQTGRTHFRWLIPLSGVAACITIVYFLLLTTSGEKANAHHAAQNTVSTRKGSKTNIQLPDGTMAWLNADSKLVYDENFRGDQREVYLEGEAFFDVVKDKSRPFIIHTKTIDIRVLGTAFNVRAYTTEKTTETALFRGSVEVTLHNNPEKKIVLKPNEKLMVNNKSFQFATHKSDQQNGKSAPELSLTVGKVHFQEKDSSAWETMWIKNKLVFDAESLEEVAQKVERWYNVKVIVSGDDDLKKTTYSAIFENENLSQVMEALTITGNFKYAINKDTITIR